MSHEPGVSVIIPAHGAKATMPAAGRIRLAQTDPWQASVASDDVERLAVPEGAGIRHDRLQQVSTGAWGRGEGKADDVALTPAPGAILCTLNANDGFTVKGLFRHFTSSGRRVSLEDSLEPAQNAGPARAEAELASLTKGAARAA